MAIGHGGLFLCQERCPGRRWKQGDRSGPLYNSWLEKMRSELASGRDHRSKKISGYGKAYYSIRTELGKGEEDPQRTLGALLGGWDNGEALNSKRSS